MKKTIEVDLNEIKRIFSLLENVNNLFHQPMNYEDAQVVESFAKVNYAEISDLYYNVVWKWLPKDVQEDILER